MFGNVCVRGFICVSSCVWHCDYDSLSADTRNASMLLWDTNAVPGRIMSRMNHFGTLCIVLWLWALFCLSLSVYVYQCVFVWVFLCVSLSGCVSVSVCLCVSVWVSVWFRSRFGTWKVVDKFSRLLSSTRNARQYASRICVQEARPFANCTKFLEYFYRWTNCCELASAAVRFFVTFIV